MNKMKNKYYVQNVAEGKGRIVRYIQDEHPHVWVIDLELRFPYKVLRTNFEKYYDRVNWKKIKPDKHPYTKIRYRIKK